jgi:hypothetical protein
VVGEGVDAIDFLAKHRGLANADACREYIRLAGVASPINLTPTQSPFDRTSCVTALTAEQRAHLGKVERICARIHWVVARGKTHWCV